MHVHVYTCVRACVCESREKCCCRAQREVWEKYEDGGRGRRKGEDEREEGGGEGVKEKYNVTSSHTHTHPHPLPHPLPAQQWSSQLCGRLLNLTALQVRDRVVGIGWGRRGHESTRAPGKSSPAACSLFHLLKAAAGSSSLLALFILPVRLFPATVFPVSLP